MRVGLQIPNFTYPASHPLRKALKDIVQMADQGGFYSIWTMDHFFQIEYVGPPEWDMLEGYSTLSYFAALTEKVKLGTMVTGVVYRHPGLLVKTLTTLDVLSGGRAYLGIGAAWFQREAQALGVPFPPLKERFEQLEETLRIAQQMWSPNNGPFVGKHYKLAETLCVPQPISKPHPPILIGGSGEQKTLRMVAKYANACNLFLHLGPDVLRQKLEILKRHCDAEKRPYSDIEKTTLGSVRENMSSQDVIQSCKQAAELGFQHAIFNFENVHTLKPLERFIKDVIPAVSGL